MEGRGRRSDGTGYTTGEELGSGQRASTKLRRSKKCRIYNDSNSLENCASDRGSGGVPKEEVAVETGQPEDGQGHDARSTPEDIRSRFYEDYRKVADEYDKEFNKRYDEDLNTTLIFAGLFSAVTSAFIIQVDSQLQPDPNEETAALLRVLIYKIDNTTFGGDVPTLPQWFGPPSTIVQVQAILYASLAASLLSAFLAMLGKQWLNRYVSTDMRGTAAERSQNRQRKLNGIVSWYFEYVMESLPLMLQAALLLLGCALCLYLWDIDTTIASVVLGVTSFGVAFYLFIVAAGITSESCPYQTPGSRILRSAPPILASAFRRAIGRSETVRMVQEKKWWWESWWSVENIKAFLMRVPRELPSALGLDAFRLGRTVIYPLVVLVNRIYTRLLGSPSTPPHGSHQRTTTLDLQCISWILRASLDKVVHLSTLESLAAIASLADFDPTLVVDCFNTFAGCAKVANNTVVITRGLERLAAASALCLLRTFSRLSVVDPTSDVLGDIRRRYSRIFPPTTNFEGLPFFHIFSVVHDVFYPGWNDRWLDWGDRRPSSHEHIIFAHALSDLALSEYRRRGRFGKKVPRWILRFALHSLSLDPPPPASVVADCLSIIATDLGCNVSSTTTVISNESARTDEALALISQKFKTMIEVANPDQIYSKRKAITAFYPYAAWQERNGQRDMLDVSLHTVRASKRQGFMWDCIVPLVTKLLSEENSVSLKRAAILVLPHVPWWRFTGLKRLIQLWAEATLAVPYTDEICQSVVDTLLQVASNDTLRPHIPIDMWSWLNKRPFLPPACAGHYLGSTRDVVQTVRALGDVNILTSYLFLVWSEWGNPHSDGLDEMYTSVREDFSGTGVGHHREDLLQRLDRVLGQLELGFDHLRQHKPSLGVDDVRLMTEQYGKLREILLEVDGQVIDSDEPTRFHSTSMCAMPLPCP